MSMSNYLEEYVLHATLRGSTFAYTGGDTYIALLTSAPADGTIVECSTSDSTLGYPAYARQDAKGAGTQQDAWTAYSAGSSKNTLAITFPANNNATNSVTIRGIGIYSAATAGNLLYWAALSSEKVIAPGDVLSFAVNAITVTLD